MQGILTNLRSTVIAGFVLTLILFIIVGGLIDGGFAFDRAWVAFLFRWLHVISGVMWIGLAGHGKNRRIGLGRDIVIGQPGRK